MKFVFVVLIGIIITLNGCKSISSQHEIENKIHQLYSASKPAIYDEKIDTSLFSQDIITRIKNVQKVTKADLERIRNSNAPTDKPLLLEGSVFTSLYDGYSRYAIEDILVKNNRAEVKVRFEYNSIPKEIWSDKIILIYENGWKIDNIIFSDKYSGFKNLKDKLVLKP